MVSLSLSLSLSLRGLAATCFLHPTFWCSKSQTTMSSIARFGSQGFPFSSTANAWFIKIARVEFIPPIWVRKALHILATKCSVNTCFSLRNGQRNEHTFRSPQLNLKLPHMQHWASPHKSAVQLWTAAFGRSMSPKIHKGEGGNSPFMWDKALT